MCAEGMAVVDGGYRATSYTTSGSEEISAMLNTNGSRGVGIEQQYAYQHLYPGAGGFPARPSRPPVVSSSSPPRRQTSFNMEEKYNMLEAKPEINLDGRPPFSYVENSLHRYHSAPATTFLTEYHHENENAHHGVMSLYDAPALTPITENMDMERNNYNSAVEYEHYMAPENDFGRRPVFPASLRKEEAMPDTFRNGGLLQRQTSLPLHDSRMTENNNYSEKSSSRTSDENNHLINGYTASIYSQEDFLWKSPTSPAKWHRIEGELSETSSGSADGSTYRNGTHHLVRHMSLPSSGSPGLEDAREENGSFGTMPMRTRAKRGCATHPRSIAERVRRTKISERMKRLQDLVPDMDKQTNTSDMLDETVEYVKSLQQKVQELNETVAQLKAAAAAAAQHQQQASNNRTD